MACDNCRMDQTMTQVTDEGKCTGCGDMVWPNRRNITGTIVLTPEEEECQPKNYLEYILKMKTDLEFFYLEIKALRKLYQNKILIEEWD